MVQTPRRRFSEKKLKTRAKLVDAALTAIDQHGFDAVTLDMVAAAAGVTKGAIYSNFDGKSALLLAALASRAPNIGFELTPGLSLKSQLAIFARLLIDQLPGAHGEVGFLGQFQLYALTDADLRARISATYSQRFDLMSRRLADVYAGELRIDARSLALALQSLSLGFLYQSFLTPAEVTPHAVLAGFDMLADGAVGSRG